MLKKCEQNHSLSCSDCEHYKKDSCEFSPKQDLDCYHNLDPETWNCSECKCINTWKCPLMTLSEDTYSEASM